mgnify:CR=1 FL=1
MLVGPLINRAQLRGPAGRPGASRRGGERCCAVAIAVLADDHPDAFYVQPAVVRDAGPVRASCRTETFAPIVYVVTYDELDEAIALNNAVPQGLSSSIFTSDQARGRALHVGQRLGLRHRQRQHRHLGRGDRRRVRRREGDRRRARVRRGLRGRRTCVRPPTRSTTPVELPLAQEWSSSSSRPDGRKSSAVDAATVEHHLTRGRIPTMSASLDLTTLRP